MSSPALGRSIMSYITSSVGMPAWTLTAELDFRARESSTIQFSRSTSTTRALREDVSSHLTAAPVTAVSRNSMGTGYAANAAAAATLSDGVGTR
ncbi:hypothetical protein GCG54_00012671 [Colletotrichum gloeosporioides]|uniref:Uncharacterized protein n=1 Tax=Colletotrichum gloeosporioides TaxID=474922 RepID=A0A8H4CQ60_COLGL|nr:uncharacterized protein GCG54_00012671 [Colletotrichum gloeosporioides]KAF3808091.1 hypothetical protein GCG54_00012671 [Colletotrichum gloeosporioides]